MSSLRRISDGAGDSGSMSMILWKDNVDGEIKYEHDAKPRLGVAIRVGSLSGRSYFFSQDWWQTSIITEILEEKEDYIKFKTRNSIYEWTK